MTPRLEFTLGIDLAQNSLRVAAAWPGADPERWRRLPSLPIDHPPDSPQALETLTDWMDGEFPQAQCLGIVVESTGRLSRRFADQAALAGLAAVAIVNPARVKAYAQSLGAREKSDAADAAMLALFALERRPKPTPSDPVREEIKALTRLRESYVEERTKWRNRLDQVDSKTARRFIERTLAHLDKQIPRLEADIDKAVAKDENLRVQCRSLQAIDGIGPVTARTITAELGDLRTFERNKLVAAAGVFPRVHESGQSVWKPPRMAKGGGGRLRRVLYMAATSLLRSNGPWRAYIDAMKARTKSPMQIIGALMRKLLLVARAVMIRGGKYEPDQIGRAQKVLA